MNYKVVVVSIFAFLLLAFIALGSIFTNSRNKSDISYFEDRIELKTIEGIITLTKSKTYFYDGPLFKVTIADSYVSDQFKTRPPSFKLELEKIRLDENVVIPGTTSAKITGTRENNLEIYSIDDQTIELLTSLVKQNEQRTAHVLIEGYKITKISEGSSILGCDEYTAPIFATKLEISY